MIFTCFSLHRIILGCIFHATLKSLLDVIVRCFNLFLHPFHCLSVALKDKRGQEPQAHAPHLDLLVYLILRHELTSRAASKISKRNHTNFGEHVRRHCFPKKWPPRERREHFLLLCDRQSQVCLHNHSDLFSMNINE